MSTVSEIAEQRGRRICAREIAGEGLNARRGMRRKNRPARLVDARFRTPVHNHARTFGGQSAGDRQPDAGRRAGDQGEFPGS